METAPSQPISAESGTAADRRVVCDGCPIEDVVESKSQEDIRHFAIAASVAAKTSRRKMLAADNPEGASDTIAVRHQVARSMRADQDRHGQIATICGNILDSAISCGFSRAEGCQSEIPVQQNQSRVH